MSSDDEDLLSYTPLQRSQVSSSTQRRPKSERKVSKLSLSIRPSQSQATETKTSKNTQKKSISSQPMPETSKEPYKKPVTQTTPRKGRGRNSRNNTPVKSRADKPEENCSAVELARWKFLFGSSVKPEQKPQLATKSEAERGLQEAQKRKSEPEEDMQQNERRKKVNEGVCPRCKFPCSSLEMKEIHFARCEKKNLTYKTKCPEGSNCNSPYEAHYWFHSHTDQPEDTLGEVSSVCKESDGATDGVVVIMDSDDSPTHDLDINGVVAMSSPRRSSPVASPPPPDFLLASDSGDEGRESIPLFDLKEVEREAQEYKAEKLQRDFTDHIRRTLGSRRDSVDGTSRDSTDHTRRETVGPRRDSGDSTSRDSTGYTRKETKDDSSRGSGNHTRDSIDHTRRETIEPSQRASNESRRTSESSTLCDLHLIPDVQLVEDDRTTVCFSGDKSDKSSLFSIEEKNQEEDEDEDQVPSPVAHSLDNFRDSRTPTLEDVGAQHDQAGNLEDSEGDELISSVVEDAASNFVIPAMEKVLRWRTQMREEQAAASRENSRGPSPRRSHERHSPPPCIHIHFHEAAQAPGPSQGREKGQTSILQFFKPPKPSEEGCTCVGKTAAGKESVAAWKGLMGRMQKKLVPLPVVSQSSSQDTLSDVTSKTWQQKSQKKTCPFYKYIAETNFVVDAFNYGTLDGVKAYFLSHYHYDHYVGLRKNFSHPIYCSEITAKLVNKKLGVSLRYLNPLPMWEARQVHGVWVTLLDANHCPGSVMFLFSVKPGVTHLHVGDFRAHPSMESYTALQNCSIHTLFLDTTYCSPEYDFPPQEKILEKCVSIAQEKYQENNKTLFVVGSYTIGKERVFKAIAESLNCSIWVRNNKKQILNCIDDKEIQARLTDNRNKARVHVLPMSDIKGDKLKEYLNQLRPSFTEIVGLCPTGWEFSGASGSGGLDDITARRPFPEVYIYGIPYSEHSSFSELRRFVQFIQPRKIIPTVNNGNQANRKKMEKFFQEWLAGRQLFK